MSRRSIEVPNLDVQVVVDRGIHHRVDAILKTPVVGGGGSKDPVHPLKSTTGTKAYRLSCFIILIPISTGTSQQTAVLSG